MADSLQISTGEVTAELPITEGAVRATGLAVVETDRGPLASYDPGFVNTAACRSSITYIDGDAGILEHRGYPIEELAEKSSFLEVAYLLSNGELPTATQLADWEYQVNRHRLVHENVYDIIKSFRYDAHPMAKLMASVVSQMTFYPSSRRIAEPELRELNAFRLLGKMPTLAAATFRHSIGRHPVYPSDELGYVENFLAMLFQSQQRVWRSDPRLTRALEVLFILHADHEQNCSTTAVRTVASSGNDVYTAAAAGIGALFGPLHGGANEAVLKMLREIGSLDRVPEFIQGVKNGRGRLMGFGHRVYKNYDPRAKVIKQAVDDVFEVRGMNPLLDIAVELEKIALNDDYFVSRKLYPNVDFYSGLIYEALNFPSEMFTVLFAVPRTAGWIAHWTEQLTDPDQRIIRPKQLYTGYERRTYVPMEDR
ncbi:citrate synthase [Micropruina sp.]|uniref:citrate synthase n=1 Tax=Micropruina sp. TaxID=2737536 RepID=UPI0039E69081